MATITTAQSKNDLSDSVESWELLVRNLKKSRQSRCLGRIWPELSHCSESLFWGDDEPIGSQLGAICRLLDHENLTKKKASKKAKAIGRAGDVDWNRITESSRATFALVQESTSAIVETLAFAWALPCLTDVLGEVLWWQTLGELQEIREAAISDLDVGDHRRLMLGGELGLTLAWTLRELPTCQRMIEPSWDVFTEWIEAEPDRLEDALTDGAANLRLCLGTAVRTKRLGQRIAKRNLKRNQLAELNEMAVWVAHLTRWDGSFCFGSRDMQTSSSLLEAAAEAVQDDGVRKADQFARRKIKKNLPNRMTIEVDLPESGMYSENGSILSMRPSWFEHHGWVAASFDKIEAAKIELSTGKSMLLCGDWDTTISVDECLSQPKSQWEDVCWYSDDDVHYIEMEQTWTEGVVVQRQLMVIRDDGAVLMADTVYAGDGAKIEYKSQIPVGEKISAQTDKEIREIILQDGKPRAMVLPIGQSEWRMGPSSGSVEVVESRLISEARGNTRLYAPIWFDFERRRFSRPRTWRPLTVGNDLKIAAPSDAVASRVQFGSEQWLVFRAMKSPSSWTFCGKHLASDFYCGRFDPEDGSLDELMTVEDHASDDE